MVIMTISRRRRHDTGATALNVAEAKKRFSDLLGRVAYGGETILILRRGKPMAKLVPPGQGEGNPHLADLKGWLDDEDPFFSLVEAQIRRRGARPPRVLASRRRRGKQPSGE
jgi:prevent-host-death family protein